jgi:RHS repeat-associated protein
VAGDSPSNRNQIPAHNSYTGRQFDEETGTYYYRARQYSPALRRFLQRDPLDYVDGPNCYTYTRQRPTLLSDPSGCEGWKPGGQPEEADLQNEQPSGYLWEPDHTIRELGGDCGNGDYVIYTWTWDEDWKHGGSVAGGARWLSDGGRFFHDPFYQPPSPPPPPPPPPPPGKRPKPGDGWDDGWSWWEHRMFPPSKLWDAKKAADRGEISKDEMLNEMEDVADKACKDFAEDTKREVKDAHEGR